MTTYHVHIVPEGGGARVSLLGILSHDIGGTPSVLCDTT